jgi:hypothetical protein
LKRQEDLHSEVSYKRLERHKFVWPPIVKPAPAQAGGTLTLTPAQLALLVDHAC